MSNISILLIRSVSLLTGRVVMDKSVTVRPYVLKTMAVYSVHSIQLIGVPGGPCLAVLGAK